MSGYPRLVPLFPPVGAPGSVLHLLQGRARFLTPKVSCKRREGAGAPICLAGPLYWCFPRWIPTGACPSIWEFVWKNSSKKANFFPLRSQSCPEIAHCPDGAGCWGCTVRSGCCWECWGYQGMLPPPRGRAGALLLPPPVISSRRICPLSCLFLSISPRPE